jgi:L-threonylcarbamoyladenylate synthase
MAVRVVSNNQEAIQDAALLLKDGGLVAMPTETVYGLAGNACDGRAIAKIYEAKQRPSFNPLIVHIAKIEEADNYAHINTRTHEIAHYFWPGPLTLILPRKKESPISELAMAGLDTIALRMPAHPVARDLITACGFPLVAPSANKSGSLSPTTPSHVVDSLGAAVDLVLAAGACDIGLESTVLDLTTDMPTILRPGIITAEDIQTRTGLKVAYDIEPPSDSNADRPKSPGQLLKHYAPNTPVRINAVDVKPGEALLAFGSEKFMGIQGGGRASDLPSTQRRNLSENSDLHEAAANLFAMLKDLDQPDHSAIAVMPLPNEGLGIAINDRLKRAAS